MQKNLADLPKLVARLLKIPKDDYLVWVINTYIEIIIIWYNGELHLEICLKDLLK